MSLAQPLISCDILIFKPLMYYLFRVNGKVAFIFILSIISGFPSSAKYTKELYIQGFICEKEASKTLMFTHFSNPLFILGTISIIFLNDKRAGLIVLIAHYMSNIIVGIIYRNYGFKAVKKEKISFKNALVNMSNKKTKTFGEIINNSLINTINTLLLILGVVTIFMIITTIIDQNLNLDIFSKTIISSILEMTGGLRHISLLDISLKNKSILSAMILSFGGLSVHTQIISILSGTNIKYFPFLIARITHTFIAGLLVYLFF